MIFFHRCSQGQFFSTWIFESKDRCGLLVLVYSWHKGAKNLVQTVPQQMPCDKWKSAKTPGSGTGKANRPGISLRKSRMQLAFCLGCRHGWHIRACDCHHKTFLFAQKLLKPKIVEGQGFPQCQELENVRIFEFQFSINKIKAVKGSDFRRHASVRISPIRIPVFIVFTDLRCRVCPCCYRFFMEVQMLEGLSLLLPFSLRYGLKVAGLYQCAKFPISSFNQTNSKDETFEVVKCKSMSNNQNMSIRKAKKKFFER